MSLGVIASLSVVAGFLLLTVLVLSIIEWVVSCPDDAQYIKFNNFTNLYVINPDRWILHDDFVDFRKPSTITDDGWFRSGSYIEFKFNFIDFYRYGSWKNNLEKQKRQQKECKELQEVISILKSDLEKFENKNVDNMNKATKEIGIVVEGLKENSTKAYELVQTLHSKYGATTATIDFHNPLSIGPKTRDKVFGDKEK